MSSSSILTAVFGLCSAVGAVLLFFNYRSARRLLRHGGTTTGTVTAMEDLHDEGWLAHIRYHVGGRPYDIRIGSNGGYRVGEAVAIRYLVADPSNATVDLPGHIWLGVIGALVLTVAFGGAAGLLYGLGRAFRF